MPKKGFENYLKELEEIVLSLEDEELSLEDSIEKFTKGVNIYKKCNTILNELEGKISIIKDEKEIDLDI